MAIATDTIGTGTPFAKFVAPGDTLIGAFGSSPKECKRQQRDFDTREPKLKADGRPALEEVLWLVAMPGTTAVTGSADAEFATIAVGDVVRWAVSGWKWGQVIDARKALPAHAGFAAGQPCSGDVYEITLIGWSAETRNPAQAEKAGFSVEDGRIVLRSQADKDAYVLAQSRNGGNTNPAKDYAITIRRPTSADKRWEQAADELFLAKPWKAAAAAPADNTDELGDDEPF